METTTATAGPAELLTPAEVGRMLRVDPKTVSRWAQAGKIRATRTPGGHRRIYRADVDAILAGTRS
jgi:excisionase family DNA binding protein